MNTGVLPADKNLRRKFFIFLELFTIAVILVVPYFNDYIDQIKQISKENPDLAFKKSILLLKITLGFVFWSLLITGTYLIVIARKVLKSSQYPPPGMRVIRDTRLRTGTQAKMVAISLIALSCILMVLGLFFLYWPYAFEKPVLKKKSSNAKMDLLILIKKGGEIE